MEIDVSTKTYPNQIMLIDKCDYIYIKSLGVKSIWAGKNGNLLYAVCNVNGKRSRVHRLLIPESEAVDHINHNGLDNRRFNLRPVTNRANQSNRINQGASKYVGAIKSGDRWKSEIQYNKVKYCIGTFDTDIEAARAYQVKLKELKAMGSVSSNLMK